MGMSLLMLAYFFLCNPLESRFTTKIEVMNECTILLQTYLLLCFRDIIVDEETQYNVGFYYILISLINISIHIFLLLGDTLINIKNWLRSKCCKVDRRLQPKKTPANIRWWRQLS